MTTRPAPPLLSLRPGFGCEVTLMRHHQLAREGASWPIVSAPDDVQTGRVAEVAREHGALRAEKHHRLAVQRLI